MKHTAAGPGPRHDDGAPSQSSPRYPASPPLTWRSIATTWSGAKHTPQHVESVLSVKGSGHAVSPQSIFEHAGSRRELPNESTSACGSFGSMSGTLDGVCTSAEARYTRRNAVMLLSRARNTL